jgi:hypothetical protein
MDKELNKHANSDTPPFKYLYLSNEQRNRPSKQWPGLQIASRNITSSQSFILGHHLHEISNLTARRYSIKMCCKIHGIGKVEIPVPSTWLQAFYASPPPFGVLEKMSLKYESPYFLPET